MKITPEQLEANAEWWAVRTFDHALNQNNGDTSDKGEMSFMLMNLVSSKARQSADPNARQKFKDKLIELMADKDHFNIYVDYHPDPELAEACDYAGIGYEALPCKSGTEFSKGQLKGKYQYGGQWTKIA